MAKRSIKDLKKFDMAEYLETPEDVADYLNLALEEGNDDALILALGTVARVRGMAKIAASAEVGRESLYKALREGAQPRFQTVQKVLAALGLQLHVTAA
jgi:probable addiction module antidote protein